MFYGGGSGVSANGSRPSRAGRVIGLVRDGWIRGSLTARFRKDFAKGNSPCRGIVWKTQWPVVFDRVTEDACKHQPRIDFKFLGIRFRRPSLPISFSSLLIFVFSSRLGLFGPVSPEIGLIGSNSRDTGVYLSARIVINLRATDAR